MIIGAHSIIYSTHPEADRAFLRDVLELAYVDVGDGWLVFALPPAEVAVHPSGENDVHEFYLMCDDVEALVAQMKKRRVACTPVEQQSWGLLTRLTLPGGGKLGIYEPRHARPKAARAPKSKAVRTPTRSKSAAARARKTAGRGTATSTRRSKAKRSRRS
jgi:hypothetical protein